MALSGTETLQVLGQDSTGRPAATTQTVTTAAIAALSQTGQSNASITNLNTVGAATLTAAAIISRNIVRGGVQTAVFTDTTDTAAAIITAMGAGATVGQSFRVIYVNNTVFPATIAAGSGVTLSGNAVIPANSSCEYILIYTGAGAVSMTALQSGYFPSSGTFTNNGVTPVTVANAAVTAGSVVIPTLKTVGGTVGASVPAVKTITPGTGFTIAGLASDTSVYNYVILG